MSSQIIELFAVPTIPSNADWEQIIADQYCPFIDKKCVKVRKSEPDVSIGTCSVNYGIREPKEILICPHRLLERGQIFMDCIHLLTLHEPGNEIHKLAEVQIPGGSVDYMLASVHNGKVIDFVGIELQTLDTTGSIWPYRQAFLQEVGVIEGEVPEPTPFGMNWKMTAKTILMQLHHKVETFEAINKHLVLVMQNVFLDYVQQEFQFDHIQTAKLGHSIHFHAYSFRRNQNTSSHQIKLETRISTDADGMATALGLKADANVAWETIVEMLESKISDETRLQI